MFIWCIPLCLSRKKNQLNGSPKSRTRKIPKLMFSQVNSDNFGFDSFTVSVMLF